MMRAAALFAVLVMPAACSAETLTAYASQPKFSSTKLPVTTVDVPWRASRPLTRGLQHWASGRRDIATKWFEAAVRDLPGDPIAWHDLGVAYYCASRFEESYRCFQHERFLYAVAPSALYGMAMCMLAVGKPELAENDLAMALVEAPHEWEYWHRFSQAFAAQGKTEAAAAAARNAARLKPRVQPPRWWFVGVSTAVLSLRFPLAPHS